MLCKVINSSKNNLEEDINKWLKTGKYEIKTVTQTESADNGYVTITILYYDISEVRQKKLENINVNL